ncbi:NEDD8 activating enzyme [Rozella allomycis CSF55]|uniref:NEDD8-activating enzyme E1 catalytic subunit n=1 Tax=Rozella allomycis (strain CSF55) TaxID=988480 RepID=A0A4P9YNU6_ROZAC|nr:NEDD8 activating enzyme [Rozella allomycis CSF55]
MEDSRSYDLDIILNSSGPFTGEGFESSSYKDDSFLKIAKILVIGAGGLGCELLKDLALSGFTDIHVIDMDTIDVSNLNRQFLFTEKDVGNPKSVVAAQAINRAIPSASITPHYCKIQEKDESFYSQFNVIVCGLDSVSARRWINALLCQMVKYDDEGNVIPDSIIPLIDGGTEGFKGQARVILPKLSSCFECSLEMFPPQTTFPMCTIANTPRLPEHCIEYASVVEWPKNFPNVKMDKDNAEHMKWLYETALTRANQFNIKGVTYRLTLGVIKNIIPAIASTNAIIAAACSLEVFKLVTRTSNFLNNYMMYNGIDGVYTYSFEYERKADCVACGNESSTLSVDPAISFGDFIDHFIQNHPSKFKTPSFRTAEKTLYMQTPPSLEEATRPNLSKSLRELLQENTTMIVTDPNLPIILSLTINFKRERQ